MGTATKDFPYGQVFAATIVSFMPSCKSEVKWYPEGSHPFFFLVFSNVVFTETIELIGVWRLAEGGWLGMRAQLHPPPHTAVSSHSEHRFPAPSLEFAVSSVYGTTPSISSLSPFLIGRMFREPSWKYSAKLAGS